MWRDSSWRQLTAENHRQPQGPEEEDFRAFLFDRPRIVSVGAIPLAMAAGEWGQAGTQTRAIIDGLDADVGGIFDRIDQPRGQ